MFLNQRSGCSRCCRCCGYGDNSTQLSGTVTGFLPVAVSYTMALSGNEGTGYGFIPSGSVFADEADDRSGCGCGCSGRMY